MPIQVQILLWCAAVLGVAGVCLVVFFFCILPIGDLWQMHVVDIDTRVYENKYHLELERNHEIGEALNALRTEKAQAAGRFRTGAP